MRWCQKEERTAVWGCRHEPRRGIRTLCDITKSYFFKLRVLEKKKKEVKDVLFFHFLEVYCEVRDVMENVGKLNLVYGTFKEKIFLKKHSSRFICFSELINDHLRK